MNDVVLITGIAGFIGRAVAREFARAGWRVVGIDDSAPENASVPRTATYVRARLPDSRLKGVLEAEKPTACIHCAGRASVPLSIEDPEADFRGNTILTFELLENIRRHAPDCRFVMLSSAAVYGNPGSLPVSESSPTQPLSPYGYHKLQSELLCEEFSRVFGLKTAVARIFSAYGPGLRRQVVWDLCAKILADGPLNVFGTGKESRDFVHVTDVARALELIVRQPGASADRFNIASGDEVTIEHLIELLAEVLGKTVEPRFDGRTRAGDPVNWRADIQRLTDLGFASSIELRRGLEGVASWAKAELLGS